MKIVILIVFAGALISGSLSLVRVLSATSLVPPILFAVAMILALLNVINESDQKP